MQTDYPFGPLANMGMVNPFFYHLFEDDFDQISTEAYTATKTGNGTIAVAAGDGGLALFTTNSSSPATTDIASLQVATAGFSLTLGKKQFALTRLQLSSATNAAFLFGLIQQSTTPFTVTDGIYFSKASGALNNLNIISAVGGVFTTVAIPTSAYTLANTTNLDLGFYVDRKGTIYAFVGAQLVGWLAQSGTGSSVGSRGAVASMAPALTTANLTPTIAIQSGTAASSTMTVDFLMAAKER
ncbi:MAG: hypothetical protein ACREQ5_05065 [Candidatus Dormibacteria bacterium]